MTILRLFLSLSLGGLVGCSDLPDYDDPRDFVESEEESCDNLLDNGDFDRGDASWGTTDAIKSESSYRDRGLYAESGSFFVWLGGDYSVTQTMEQTVDVPRYAKALRLDGEHIVGTEADAGSIEDTLRIEVVGFNGSAETVLSLSNQNPTPGEGWTWRNFSRQIGDFSGGSMTLRFTAMTNATLNTNFLFDTLSLKPASCPK